MTVDPSALGWSLALFIFTLWFIAFVVVWFMDVLRGASRGI